MDEPQHAHEDEVAVGPRVENAGALVIRAVEVAGLVFERHVPLGEKQEGNRHLFGVDVAGILH